ncbi:unnamed protein product [Protopolystoma xenopodis]|uniref:Uncharacterized protein n=1 Tax=Protopolystoma xenopodis TaxID=117903 RepID=A0A3S5CPP3_9PLAT|nr:unnamed protein product [Protopolystoma xenopodis]
MSRKFLVDKVGKRQRRANPIVLDGGDEVVALLESSDELILHGISQLRLTVVLGVIYDCNDDCVHDAIHHGDEAFDIFVMSLLGNYQ